MITLSLGLGPALAAATPWAGGATHSFRVEPNRNTGCSPASPTEKEDWRAMHLLCLMVSALMFRVAHVSL